MKTDDVNEYDIVLAKSEVEMQSIIDFFLSEASFDDRKFTPGELVELKRNPISSLNENNYFYWYAKDKTGKIIAALGVKENSQKTGGFRGDYCVVHRDFRKLGIAQEMHKMMFAHLQNRKARYLIIQTCDTPSYIHMVHLLEHNGFELVGHCPDYYYKNEGMLLYMKRFKAN